MAQLAARIGAELVEGDGRIEIGSAFAGDRISDLLNRASDGALLITNLTGEQVLRVAELMEVPAICFCEGRCPDESCCAAARRCDKALVVSPAGLFETCGRIHACLGLGKEVIGGV
ncbi:MAG: hypothetical protein JXR96_06060 [Deltaproteobacteria bacterium]|nr:hypothetical protein [Deltaproteobacteria bacterium]